MPHERQLRHYGRRPDANVAAATSCLQRLQKIDQILHLLGGKVRLKAIVVGVHDVRQVGGGAIVKVRSACGESTGIDPVLLPSI